jgi:hypothetical protein
VCPIDSAYCAIKERCVLVRPIMHFLTCLRA